MTSAVLLGLAAAVAYGIGDFVAGWLSRRMHYVLVAVVGALVSLVVTAPALALTAPGAPTIEALGWGAASGLGSGFGTLMLFRGLARGRMGIVAPLSALGAAVLPVVIGVAIGDRPSALAWFGVLAALPAIWLVSTSGAQGPEDAPRPATGRPVVAAGVVDGLLAGVGFALLFVGLNLAGDESGLWPVVAGQGTALAVLGIVTVGRLPSIDVPRASRRDLIAAASVGILGAAASVLYFLSTQAGLLSIVAVLTSLYPAVTVLLAASLLHEAISRRQAIGLALAGVAVVLIVLG